jgi:hypothetical protein
MHTLLGGHECTTAQRQGWGGITNGDLIRRAAVIFDVFVTTDQNIAYQQNLAGRRIAILILSSNDLRRIRAAGAAIVSAVSGMAPGAFRQLLIP